MYYFFIISLRRVYLYFTLKYRYFDKFIKDYKNFVAIYANKEVIAYDL